MRQVRTHADLQAFFRKEAAPLDPDQDVEAKIRNSLRIAAEDLDIPVGILQRRLTAQRRGRHST